MLSTMFSIFFFSYILPNRQTLLQVFNTVHVIHDVLHLLFFIYLTKPANTLPTLGALARELFGRIFSFISAPDGMLNTASPIRNILAIQPTLSHCFPSTQL